MLTIFGTLLVCILVAFLATQNATLVTLHLASSTLTDVPLFFVVLVSILVGVGVASVITLINWVKSKITIVGQRGQLKKTYKTMGEMQQRLTQLEDENTVLREQLKTVVIES